LATNLHVTPTHPSECRNFAVTQSQVSEQSPQR